MYVYVYVYGACGCGLIDLYDRRGCVFGDDGGGVGASVAGFSLDSKYSTLFYSKFICSIFCPGWWSSTR